MEIKFFDVNYTYKNAKEGSLKDITLSFKEGKVNGLIGPSGSGKTTILELAEALITPTKGFIKIDDYLIEKKKKILNINDLRINIGFVFQFPEDQFFNLTVKNELEVALKFFKKKEKDSKLKEVLEMVELDESYLDRDPFTLSNGEMRKVAIASALIHDPKILIFDEPTIGLDYQSKNNLIRLIRTLNKKYKKTIIIASHDTDMLLKIVDYIFILNKGKLLMEGPKYEVFKNTELLIENNITIPKLITFSNLVYDKKKIKLGYRDEINDLIKDIYRYAR